MYASVKRASHGGAKYLRDGVRKDSKYNRHDKDNVISLYGDLDILEKTEDYLYYDKKQDNNYTTVVVSFSDNDTNKLNAMDIDKRKNVYNDIAMQYIKHFSSGYNLNNEVIAYAEVHEPKIKYNEDKKVRLPHIHIQVMHYNAIDDTKLRTAFANNSFIPSVIQTKINKEYGFDYPDNFKRDNKSDSKTKIALERKNLIEQFSKFSTQNEVRDYLRDNNIKYRDIKSNKNEYIKILNKDGNDINIRGKGFEHLHGKDTKNFKDLKRLDIKDLSSILDDYYKSREKNISARRSARTTKILDELKSENKPQYSKDIQHNNNNKFESYQQKIFFEKYHHQIKRDLKGYYIETKNNETRLTNKKENVDITDKGDSIITKNEKSMDKQIDIMLDVAEAKGWKIETLEISGTEQFIKMSERKIAERIKAKEDKQTDKPKVQEVKSRAVNELDNINQDRQNDKVAIEKKTHITKLKQDVKANDVLTHAIEKYKINPNDYEVSPDNKINNKTNKQKPKNVIDFMQKEIGIQMKDAINELQAIKQNANEQYKARELKIVNEQTKEEESKSYKGGIEDENKRRREQYNERAQQNLDSARAKLRTIVGADKINEQRRWRNEHRRDDAKIIKGANGDDNTRTQNRLEDNIKKIEEALKLEQLQEESKVKTRSL